MTRLLMGSLLLTASLVLAGKMEIEGGKKITVPNVISVSADWIKPKGSKFDIRLNIQNESKQTILVFLNEMRCKRGNKEGSIKHTFFNTGERTIDFRPGQMKSFNMVCNVGVETEGDYRVILSSVYDNPNNDFKTKGKVLATNVEWVLTQLEAK